MAAQTVCCSASRSANPTHHQRRLPSRAGEPGVEHTARRTTEQAQPKQSRASERSPSRAQQSSTAQLAQTKGTHLAVIHPLVGRECHRHLRLRRQLPAAHDGHAARAAHRHDAGLHRVGPREGVCVCVCGPAAPTAADRPASSLPAPHTSAKAGAVPLLAPFLLPLRPAAVGCKNPPAWADSRNSRTLRPLQPPHRANTPSQHQHRAPNEAVTKERVTACAHLERVIVAKKLSSPNSHNETKKKQHQKCVCARTWGGLMMAKNLSTQTATIKQKKSKRIVCARTHLGRVDDGEELVHPKHAQVGDRERAPLELLRRQLVGACPRRQVAHLGGRAGPRVQGVYVRVGCGLKTGAGAAARDPKQPGGVWGGGSSQHQEGEMRGRKVQAAHTGPKSWTPSREQVRPSITVMPASTSTPTPWPSSPLNDTPSTHPPLLLLYLHTHPLRPAAPTHPPTQHRPHPTPITPLPRSASRSWCWPPARWA